MIAAYAIIDKRGLGRGQPGRIQMEEHDVKELEVRIVTLPPLQVASVTAYGAEPETQAWDKLEAWAKARGLWELGGERRVFGFNNPNPSPGTPEYGYEYWLTLTNDELMLLSENLGEATIRQFGGGRYAVTRCTGVERIAPMWKRLSVWVEDHVHRPGRQQWLEEHMAVGETLDDLVLDLYYPLAG